MEKDQRAMKKVVVLRLVVQVNSTCNGMVMLFMQCYFLKERVE